MTTLNGVEFTRTGNPQADLVTYAKARGIDEAQAKEELEAEFGVAKAVNESKDEEVSLASDNDTSSLSTEDFLKGFIAKLLSLLGLDASKLEETSSTTEDTEETSSTDETEEASSSTSTTSTDDDDDESTTTSSCSGSSSISANKQKAYDNLTKAEDRFKYAADNGWHNVKDLYQQVLKAKKAYEETA